MPVDIHYQPMYVERIVLFCVLSALLSYRSWVQHVISFCHVCMTCMWRMATMAV